MALNTFKCNHMMPLYFKGLTHGLLHYNYTGCTYVHAVSVTTAVA